MPRIDASQTRDPQAAADALFAAVARALAARAVADWAAAEKALNDAYEALVVIDRLCAPPAPGDLS